ncbi:MAG: thiamine diphosphokinase [Eggerthellaceae bacterium]|nr:thiamine diphosphokinase [Eggerthellaceae bacterium]
MKACALVGASEFNAEHFQAMDAQNAFNYVIAVDAGLKHLESIGRTPDMALGDFDSLGYVPQGMRVARFSANKNKSDMDLALERARNMRYDEIFVYGALGGRLDHTLANLQLFAKYSEKGAIVNAIGVSEAATYVTGPDTYEMPAQESGTISVFSMSDEARGVFERGLAYELDDASLSNRTSLGLSNEFIGEPVLIGVESGTIVVIVPFGEDL